jgi:hypothetical protein
MATDATLDDIALGDVGPAQARAALSKAFGGEDPKAAGRAYTALRAWVWKALDGRRRDAELREWFDVLKRAAAFLRTRDVALAERVAALHELIHESIVVSERLPMRAVLQRRHVRDVLAMLVVAPGGRLDRAEVGRRLGLKQGNLTRVLNMVTEAGLAERTVHGKQAEFQLTRAGLDAAAELGFRKPSPKPAARTRVRTGRRTEIVPLPGALGVAAGAAIYGSLERDGFTLLGYASNPGGALVDQSLSRGRLYGKAQLMEHASALALLEKASAEVMPQGSPVRPPLAPSPARRSRKARAEAAHD